MNKKLIFAATACAALAACSMAVTACDTDDKKPTEEDDGIVTEEDDGTVTEKDDIKATEEEWKQACENMTAMENFTLRSNYYELNEGEEFKSEMTYYITQNSIFMSSIDKVQGEEDYTEKSYYLIENSIVYFISKSDSVWEVRSKSVGSINEIREEVLTYYDGNYRISPESETLPLKDLYSAFAYKDGTFSARLYIDVGLGEEFAPIDVSLKINGGYLTYYAYDIEMVNGENTNKRSIEFKAENIGNTSFTVDPDAQSALKNYIGEHTQN